MKQNRRQSARSRAAGYSLLELVIVAALFLVVVASLAIVARGSDQLYETEAVGSHLEGQAAVALDQIVRELRIAGFDTLIPDPGAVGTSSIEYRQAIDIEAGEVTWTAPRRLEFQYETGEVDDGVDNNGNGLIDEGRVVLTTDVDGPEEWTRVITRWVPEFFEGEVPNNLDDNGNLLVDEQGFVLERVGESLVVRLMLQRRTRDGRLLTRRSQTSVRPRNRVEPEEEEEEE